MTKLRRYFVITLILSVLMCLSLIFQADIVRDEGNQSSRLTREQNSKQNMSTVENHIKVDDDDGNRAKSDVKQLLPNRQQLVQKNIMVQGDDDDYDEDVELLWQEVDEKKNGGDEEEPTPPPYLCDEEQQPQEGEEAQMSLSVVRDVDGDDNESNMTVDNAGVDFSDNDNVSVEMPIPQARRRPTTALPPNITARICHIRLIADYYVLRHMVGLKNPKKFFRRTMAEMFAIVDKYFRRLDLDDDGKPDNIGFHVDLMFMKPERYPGDHQRLKDRWNQTSFFRMMYDQDYGDACIGIYLTYRMFDNNTEYENWHPALFRMNTESAEVGICSTRRRDPPDKYYDDLGGRVTNILPFSMYRPAAGPSQSWRGTQLALFHQFGHMFGARDDDVFSNSTGGCPSNHPKYYQHAMLYPPPSGDCTKTAFAMSKCSLRDMKKFMRNYNRPNCLKPCFYENKCVQDFSDAVIEGWIPPRGWKGWWRDDDDSSSTLPTTHLPLDRQLVLIVITITTALATSTWIRSAF